MKILILHCDYIRYKPIKKAIKEPEIINAKEKEGIEIKEPLVILTAVEEGDNLDSIKPMVSSIKDVAGQVGAKKIVLYPYAHLSSSLAKPAIAKKLLSDALKELKKQNLEAHRAPFGYYKEFELKCKGHPLSELSREIAITKKGEVKEEYNPDELLKKMSKIKMSTKKPPKGLKSNIELGRDLDLYIVSEIVGGGLPLFTPKGAAIKREIERFVTDEELKRGYLHTATPIMAKSDLYKVSGHWQHYKKDMFVLNVRGEDFALRPMTCPFQFILYKRKPRSYKNLPLKYAEVATLFRNEQSGELRGLTRVRQFNLADAHIICTPEQLEKEFEKVLDLVKYCMKKLGIKEKDIWYRFSKWDPKNKEKYIDNPEAWNSSEKVMKKILKKLKLKHKEVKDEAAFYGPKLDLQYNDVYGKEDTLLTIQIDFALPERFDLTYRDKNNKMKRPMIIHRSSTGATERMIAYLLEKTQGNLPLWLSPIQVKVLPMTDKNKKTAEKIIEQLKKENIRAELDDRDESMSKKVRDAQTEKAYYMVTIGDKEQKAKTLAVRARNGKVKYGVKPVDFIKQLKKEIEDKK